jgi:hypothetical protein
MLAANFTEQPMDDASVLGHITQLVEEERRLRADSGKPDHDAEKLRKIEEHLDQCWDLLRQRRAKREFGGDPDSAEVRDGRTVKGYIG